jgi:alpha-tubulin suppressor-like RCC1 family protein
MSLSLFSSVGREHSFCLDSEGRVYGWGSNKHSQLTGKSENDRVLSPIPIQLEKPCVSVGATYDFSSSSDFCIFTDSELYFNSLFSVSVLIVRNQFSWAVDCEHALWMWGENIGGQLAQPDRLIIETPTRVLDSSGQPLLVEKVAATNYATYCSTVSGILA